MKHSATQTLYGHWRSMCGNRRTPDRNDLDPTAIRSVLSYTFMLEVDKGPALSRDYPIRLSGTRLDALFGRDLKGTSFISLWRGVDQTQMRLLIADVMDDARPALVGSRGAPSGCIDVALELVLLPLRHAGRTHTRILCSLSPAVIPTWIGLEPADPLTLVSWRMLDDEVAQERRRQFSTRGASCPPDGGTTVRNHLVVHEGGKGRDSFPVPQPQSPFNTAGAQLRGFEAVDPPFMSSLRRTDLRPQERRRHQRVAAVLLGRYMLADRQEYPCQSIDMSPGGLAIIAPVIGAMGERVVCYLNRSVVSKEP